MIYTLLIFLISSLFIFGLNSITKEGQLLFFLRAYLTMLIGEYWTKPIVACVICMPSLWGTVSFWINESYAMDLPLWVWPVWCICLAGLNSLIQEFKPPKFV